ASGGTSKDSSPGGSRAAHGTTIAFSRVWQESWEQTAPFTLPSPEGTLPTVAFFSVNVNFVLSSFVSPTTTFQGNSLLMCQSPLATTITCPLDTVTSNSSSACAGAEVTEAPARSARAARRGRARRDESRRGAFIGGAFSWKTGRRSMPPGSDGRQGGGIQEPAGTPTGVQVVRAADARAARIGKCRRGSLAGG